MELVKRSLIYRQLNGQLRRFQEDKLATQLIDLGFNAWSASRMLVCAMKEMYVWQMVR